MNSVERSMCTSTSSAVLFVLVVLFILRSSFSCPPVLSLVALVPGAAPSPLRLLCGPSLRRRVAHADLTMLT